MCDTVSFYVCYIMLYSLLEHPNSPTTAPPGRRRRAIGGRARGLGRALRRRGAPWRSLARRGSTHRRPVEMAGTG